MGSRNQHKIQDLFSKLDVITPNCKESILKLSFTNDKGNTKMENLCAFAANKCDNIIRSPSSLMVKTEIDENFERDLASKQSEELISFVQKSN